MPRVTRAAVRSNALLEDSNVAALTPLPLTPVKERAVFGEITNNQGKAAPSSDMTEEAIELGKVGPSKKGHGKGKKGNVAKKGKKQGVKAEEVNVEILEDDYQSETSSAVEEACQDLMKESSGEIHQVVMHDQRPRTPPSPAVFQVQKALSSRPQTPRFDPKVHKLDDTIDIAALEQDKDAFAETIISRSPARLMSYDGACDVPKHSQMEDDAPLAEEDAPEIQTTSISPAKSVTRIEDTVEAIDAFEDEMEKIGELLPAINDTQLPTEDPNTDQSAVAGKTASKPATATGRKPSNGNKVAASKNNAAKVVRKKTVTKPRQCSTTRSAQLATKKTLASASVSRTSVTKTTASSRTSTTFGPAKTPTTTHARVSSLQKAPFQPTKSSKPPTRPSFELPGEAISRKLKEQREEGLKKEAEAEAQKKTFKARPVRVSTAPVIKPTATSKARISLARANPADTKNQAPKIKPIEPRESMAAPSANKRLSTLSVAKRAPTPSTTTSTRMSHGPSVTNPAPSRTTSLSSRASLNTRAITAAVTGGVRQTSRGKEVFGRTKAELEAREKERKDKEDAVKRSRGEAAERGRLASRMWAEKQKAKKGAAAEKVGAEVQEEVGSMAGA